MPQWCVVFNNCETALLYTGTVMATSHLVAIKMDVPMSIGGASIFYRVKTFGYYGGHEPLMFGEGSFKYISKT
eukprot:scaffold25760_cov47-Attheya_sp.AAC.1